MFTISSFCWTEAYECTFPNFDCLFLWLWNDTSHFTDRNVTWSYRKLYPGTFVFIHRTWAHVLLCYSLNSLRRWALTKIVSWKKMIQWPYSSLCVLAIAAFDMRFPREEWTNALKYYQPTSKSTINQIESHETIPEKKYTEEEKENVSQLLDHEMKC